jgi:hypothetical protein
MPEYGEFQKYIIFQWEELRAQPIERRRKTSPTRFVKAVIIPAAKDFGFW